MKKLVFSVATACFAGCAAAPQHIEPAFVAQSNYDAVECSRLERTQLDTNNRLEALTKEQTRAHNMGTLWALLGSELLVNHVFP